MNDCWHHQAQGTGNPCGVILHEHVLRVRDTGTVHPGPHSPPATRQQLQAPAVRGPGVHRAQDEAQGTDCGSYAAMLRFHCY